MAMYTRWQLRVVILSYSSNYKSIAIAEVNIFQLRQLNIIIQTLRKYTQQTRDVLYNEKYIIIIIFQLRVDLIVNKYSERYYIHTYYVHF